MYGIFQHEFTISYKDLSRPSRNITALSNSLTFRRQHREKGKKIKMNIHERARAIFSVIDAFFSPVKLIIECLDKIM